LVNTLLLTCAVMDDTPPPPADQTPPPPPPTIHSGSPTDFLKGVVGKRVIVRLNSGVDYRGMTFGQNQPPQAHLSLKASFRVWTDI